MKKILLILLFQFIGVIAFSQTGNTDIALIPEPVSLIRNTGLFVLPSDIFIQTSDNAEAKNIGTELGKYLTVPTGYHAIING